MNNPTSDNLILKSGATLTTKPVNPEGTHFYAIIEKGDARLQFEIQTKQGFINWQDHHHQGDMAKECGLNDRAFNKSLDELLRLAHTVFLRKLYAQEEADTADTKSLEDLGLEASEVRHQEGVETIDVCNGDFTQSFARRCDSETDNEAMWCLIPFQSDTLFDDYFASKGLGLGNCASNFWHIIGPALMKEINGKQS